MSFLHNNESEYIAARITSKGREKIAEGNFKIEYFQIGDSEFDYNFSEFNGTDIVLNPPQKVLAPLDKDSIVKYPYKLSESTVSGTTFGNPILASLMETLTNNMGAAGFVSQYIPYSGGTGSTIECNSIEINITALNGTTSLTLPGGDFSTCEYITIIFSTLVGPTGIISGLTNSLVYKVVNVAGDVLTLDRNTPDLTLFLGTASVICNDCTPNDTALECDANTGQGDSWELNIVWGDKPAGMDVPASVDESLTGYSSNVFVSTKEFLGYTSSAGQLENTGTTISNSFFETINVLPEEQHSLAVIHYSKISTHDDPEKFYKYEDYIGHIFNENIEYFEIYIPFIIYHRNTGTTIGARFHMGETDYFINSKASDTKLNQLKYRYLLDEQDISVGKIFVNNKIIVIDDQEIVAALDYKSNRRYTLPIPAVSQIPLNVNCGTGNSSTALMSGTTAQTLFLSYLFQVTAQPNMNALHCNHYGKITGTTLEADASMSFNIDEFTFMKTTLDDYLNGYIGDKFFIIAQLVDAGDKPTSDGWKIIDFTSQIPNHTVGDYIDPANMSGTKFIITKQEYDDADRYDLESYLGNFPDEPSSDPEFGDDQPFPGSIKLTRATDLQIMRFLVNLPDGEFTTTQNPTWSTGKSKRITEIALLDSNKDVMVIGKTPKPILRSGTQVFAVKIDF